MLQSLKTIRLSSLVLPGFMPDAVPFAVRTTLALILAYFVAFYAQLDSASSAGVCVAIVAQPAAGMTLSKAVYRVIGTLVGGVVAVLFAGLFSQDRTLLLVAFALWLGVCTFVAALLRDFRSYGAVLCGYTVGIIAISTIDAPEQAVLVAMNRVAAILVGIASVAVVNSVLVAATAYDTLVAALRTELDAARTLAADVLTGAGIPDDDTFIERGSAILLLRTEASYVAVERSDGGSRSDGARAAIAGLLGMLAAIRCIGAAPLSAAARAELSHFAAALDGDISDMPELSPLDTAEQAVLIEQAMTLLEQHRLAQRGLSVLLHEAPAGPPVRLRRHIDGVGAALSAGRTIIAVGLGAVFCINANWPGATLLLVQQAAFTALFGMQPNPSAAARTIGYALPVGVVAAGLVGFALLPQISGFGPFSIIVGIVCFGFCLAARHPETARFGPGLILYFVLLLSPSNVQTFDLMLFLNNVMIQLIAIVFMLLGFWLILPVSRERRLFRIVLAGARDLSRALRGCSLDPAAVQSLHFDRLAQAYSWSGRRTPARARVLSRLFAFAELETALRRAWSAVEEAAGTTLPGDPAIAVARDSLRHPTPAGLQDAARALLPLAGDRHRGTMRAISGLYDAGRLLTAQGRALDRYRVREV